MKTTPLERLFSLRGKTALVTGASGQLGHQFATALHEAGADLILADMNLEACGALSRRLTRGRQRAITVQMDVTDRRSVTEAVRTATKHLRSIDILVNNAGIAVFTPFVQRTDEEWRRVMDVNVYGTFLCSQVVAEGMIRRRRGVIINIGSIYGVVSADPRVYGKSGRNSSEVYGASKAGVIQMTKYLAVHLAPHQIRVNAISPGGVFNNQKAPFVKQYERKTPMARMAQATDMKGAVVYLASDASAYVTGHNLLVDGGFSLW